MLKIRLQRVGRRNEPSFRLVVTDSQNSTKSGKSLEVLGSFDSRRAEKAEINADRINHWISMGAQVSGTVHNLLVSRKIISGKKINVLPKKKPIKKEGDAAAAPVAEATPAPAPAEAPAPTPEPEATPAPTESTPEAPAAPQPVVDSTPTA